MEDQGGAALAEPMDARYKSLRARPVFPKGATDLVGLLAYMGWRHLLSDAASFEHFDPSDPLLDHQIVKDGRRQCGGDVANFGRFLSKLWGIRPGDAMRLCHEAYQQQMDYGRDLELPSGCDFRTDPVRVWRWLKDRDLEPPTKSLESGEGLPAELSHTSARVLTSARRFRSWCDIVCSKRSEINQNGPMGSDEIATPGRRWLICEGAARYKAFRESLKKSANRADAAGIFSSCLAEVGTILAQLCVTPFSRLKGDDVIIHECDRTLLSQIDNLLSPLLANGDRAIGGNDVAPFTSPQIGGPAASPTQSEKVELTFHPNRVELCGKVVCGTQNERLLRPILNTLRVRDGNGQYRRFSAKTLASMVSAKRDQQGVIEAIRRFRHRVNRVLCEARGQEWSSFVVIDNDRGSGNGYRFSNRVTTTDSDDPENDPDPARRNDPDAASLNLRQNWILTQLAKGGRIRREDVEAEFHVSAKTAKRDFKGLRDASRVKFVGPARTGHYEAAEKAG